MTLPDLVAFLGSNCLTLRSCSFGVANDVAGFTCDPFPEPPAPVHVHLEDGAEDEEPDALGSFMARKAAKASD